MAAGHLSEGQEYFMKGTSLLINTAAKVVRRFLQHVCQPSVPRFLYSRQTQIINLKLQAHQFASLFPTQGEIDITQWDISLLCLILGRADVCDTVTDTERELIRDLGSLRNTVYAHIASMELSPEAYRHLCVDLERIFFALLQRIDDMDFLSEIRSDIQQTKMGAFCFGNAIAFLRNWHLHDREIIEKIDRVGETADHISMVTEETQKDTKYIKAKTEEMSRQASKEFQKLTLQMSNIYNELVRRPSRERQQRQPVENQVPFERTLELCDDLDFNLSKIHPNCQCANMTFWSMMELNSTADLNPEQYPGTTGTISFDRGLHKYVPLRISVYPPSDSMAENTLLAEICFAVDRTNVPLLTLRNDVDTIVMQLCIRQNGVHLCCRAQGTLVSTEISKTTLLGGGFCVEPGIVINGPLSKVTVLDVCEDRVIHEFQSVDFKRPLIPLFGVFQKRVWCYLYPQMRLPEVCHSICSRAIVPRHDLKFDKSTLHRQCSVTVEPDQQMLTFDPSSKPQTSDVTSQGSVFNRYTGVRGNLQLHSQSVVYFCCYIAVHPSAVKPPEDGVIAEVSLCKMDFVDQNSLVGGREGSVSIQIFQDQSKGIRILHGQKVSTGLRQLPGEEYGTAVITLGILVSGRSGKVHILDSEANVLLKTVRGVNVRETLYPVFGLFRKDVCILLLQKCLIPGICNTL